MSDPRFSFLDSVTGGGGASATDLVRTTGVRVVAGDDATGTHAGQVLVYQLTTLLARLFDQVAITGDEAALSLPKLPGLGGPFLSALRGLLPLLRPFPESPPALETVSIVVGRSDEAGQVNLGSSGWTARFSSAKCQAVENVSNPLGALAAGTLGAAEGFKYVFGPYLKGSYRPESYSLSLLGYGPESHPEPTLPDAIDVSATLFGCGSIGCGLLLSILATPQLRGELTVVDNGRFDAKNPYKYALLDWSAATGERDKASWAEELLRAHAADRLRMHGIVATADAYVAGLPEDYRLPLALSAVDTVLARMQIQDTLPRRIINAGITGTTAEVSVHGFGDGACLACLGLHADIESWDAKPIADGTGLAPERVHELIRRNGQLTHEDIARMGSEGRLPAATLARLEEFLGQPLLSLWNNGAAYSQAPVQVGGAAAIQVTTAFVSAFAGVLLLAEVVKEAVPKLRRFAVASSYRQNLLGAPAQDIMVYERDTQGWCLCHSTFRQQIYRDKYLGKSNSLASIRRNI